MWNVSWSHLWEKKSQFLQASSHISVFSDGHPERPREGTWTYVTLVGHQVELHTWVNFLQSVQHVDSIKTKLSKASLKDIYIYLRSGNLTPIYQWSVWCSLFSSLSLSGYHLQRRSNKNKVKISDICQIRFPRGNLVHWFFFPFQTNASTLAWLTAHLHPLPVTSKSMYDIPSPIVLPHILHMLTSLPFPPLLELSLSLSVSLSLLFFSLTTVALTLLQNRLLL